MFRWLRECPASSARMKIVPVDTVGYTARFAAMFFSSGYAVPVIQVNDAVPVKLKVYPNPLSENSLIIKIYCSPANASIGARKLLLAGEHPAMVFALVDSTQQ